MDPALISVYDAHERRHWWFTVRRDIIEAALSRYVPGAAEKKGRWLDVGCGTGVLLEHYQGFGEKIGAELDAGCVERARANGVDVRQTRTNWDFTAFGTFDCVSLCDVLEHVEQERDALRAAAEVLKPGGILLITVPALMSLWSDHDVANHHFRRYHKAQLLERFPADRWEVVKVSYFSTMLFPAIWTVRQFKRAIKSLRKPAPEAAAVGHDLKFGNPVVDGILRSIFQMERPLVSRMSLPVGSSLLLVLRKKSNGVAAQQRETSANVLASRNARPVELAVKSGGIDRLEERRG